MSFTVHQFALFSSGGAVLLSPEVISRLKIDKDLINHTGNPVLDHNRVSAKPRVQR